MIQQINSEESIDFFVLEGIDGSGKTSVGKNIEKLGIKYLETPSKRYIAEFPKPNNTFDSRFNYFMKGNEFTLSELSPEDIYLLGRYMHSTIISNSLLFGKSVNQAIKNAENYDLKKPVATILLTVSEEEQFRRINERNQGINEPHDERILTDTFFRRKTREYFMSTAKNEGWYIIDTTNRNLDQVTQDVFTCIAHELPLLRNLNTSQFRDDVSYLIK
ncbi:MAG: hypothetical protein ACMXYG_05470 [Candidatus Woesearchaeota archaeon]